MYDLHINASTVDLNPCHWQWINQCYFWFLSMWLSVACPSKQKMRCYHSAHHPTGSLLQVRGGCCHVALIWPASGEDVECILSAAHTAVPPLSIRTHSAPHWGWAVFMGVGGSEEPTDPLEKKNDWTISLVLVQQSAPTLPRLEMRCCHWLHLC